MAAADQTSWTTAGQDGQDHICLRSYMYIVRIYTWQEDHISKLFTHPGLLSPPGPIYNTPPAPLGQQLYTKFPLASEQVKPLSLNCVLDASWYSVHDKR